MFTKKSFLFFAIVSLSIFAGCRTGLMSDDVPAQQNQPAAVPVVVDGVRTSYADIVAKTSPAVVRIEAEHKIQKQQESETPFADDDFFRQFRRQNPQQRPPIERGLGSGVLVSGDGVILTNAHVIANADRITVITSDNKTFDAKLIGLDSPSDLAVIRIEAENLPFMNLGNSDDVRIGDIVLAIGNPLGIGQTVTAGIISAKGRRTGLSYGGGNDSFEDFLQTDAPINRGNSGGALVNLTGELIGINSQIVSGGPSGGNIGIGFSIPSNMAKSVMEQLLKDGKVHRGMLGIQIQNVTGDTAKALELPDSSGVLVNSVRQGSAAEKAGVKRGDIITAINGEKIEDTNVLRNKVAGTPPGSEIKLTVLRGGQSTEFTATLDEYSSENTSESNPEQDNKSGSDAESGKLGLTLEPVPDEIARQIGINAGEGLLVKDVDQNGAAAESGIAFGDVLLEVNRQAVNSADAVRQALENVGGRPVLLLINRRGQSVYVTVRLR